MFFVITYITRSNLRFLIDVTPAIVGSANMLIYVRVGLGWAHSPVDSSHTARPNQVHKLEFGKSTVADEYDDGRGKKQVGLVWCVVTKLRSALNADIFVPFQMEKQTVYLSCNLVIKTPGRSRLTV